MTIDVTVLPIVIVVMPVDIVEPLDRVNIETVCGVELEVTNVCMHP